ncbi:ORF12 [Halorubrum pleomorphic virus 2]|uniref:ORF12 n=1 Tax=Halorubrum pleomorphic virus 2 TaxID=1156719 RepID=H9ABM6_9VIRU|nr:ORF12 [Halorubrum pleomorphic virus 2]AFD03996.1 ORF12 [Halorubrum pleomorphic virus 2]
MDSPAPCPLGQGGADVQPLRRRLPSVASDPLLSRRPGRGTLALAVHVPGYLACLRWRAGGQGPGALGRLRSLPGRLLTPERIAAGGGPFQHSRAASGFGPSARHDLLRWTTRLGRCGWLFGGHVLTRRALW